MRLRGNYIRTLSLFVVVFLCLNPVAVICLAHCETQQVQTTAAHCPLKKQNSDCHKSKKSAGKQNTTAFDTNSAMGCVMPVNFIAAPLESKYGVVVDAAVVLPVIERTEIASVLLVRSRYIPTFHYRPPPNDLRIERVRNQVFRI